jgi:hypothetical protein
LKKPAVGRAVLIIASSLLISAFCYAFTGPIGSSGLTELTRPEIFPDSAQPPDEKDNSLMIPVSMQSQTLPDTSQAVPYDDGVTWSWEEKVSPIDIYDFIEKMPFNQWQIIDERTARALFEDIIQKVLSQWEQPQGGLLDIALREKIFRFIPEYEYFWPVYEPDPEKREVKWPVKIAKVRDKNGNPGVYFKLGRPDDEFRYILIGFNKQPDGSYLIYPIIKETYKWRPERADKPKTISYGFIVDKENNTVEIGKKTGYKGETDTIEIKDLLKFQKGNPIPIVDNTEDDPLYDLSGLDLILSPEKLEFYDNNYEAFERYAYQTFRSIIDLCKLQLGLVENGYELEKFLRRYFLDFLSYDRDTVYYRDEFDRYRKMTKNELLQELERIKTLEYYERNWRLAYAIYAIREKMQEGPDTEFATEAEKLLLEILDEADMSYNKPEAAINPDVDSYLWRTLTDLSKESETALEVFDIFYKWAYTKINYYTLPNCPYCPKFETVDIARKPSADPDKVIYWFGIGRWDTARYLEIAFSKEIGRALGLDWGIAAISYTEPVEMTYEKDGQEKQGVGEEVRDFEFVYGLPFLNGDRTQIGADYTRFLADPTGKVLTPREDILVAVFEYGNPSLYALRPLE